MVVAFIIDLEGFCWIISAIERVSDEIPLVFWLTSIVEEHLATFPGNHRLGLTAAQVDHLLLGVEFIAIEGEKLEEQLVRSLREWRYLSLDLIVVCAE